jgi:predicted DNA-binding antitoxin AbrB/MazE fold protein
MSKVLAIFENGVFKPEEPVNLRPGTKVEVTLPDEQLSPSEQLHRRYPLILDDLSDEEAAELTQIIEEEFGQVDPDEWR